LYDLNENKEIKMSDSVDSVQSKRTEEAQQRQNMQELRKIKGEHQNQYNAIVKTNKSQIDKLQKDYEVELSSQKNELERKIGDMRKKHESRTKKKNFA
jgi:hypothetical protein